jgi:hypothetical protein
MSQVFTQIDKLYAEAFRQLGHNRPVPQIEVKFYPYTGLNHTIRLRSGCVYVRISDIIADAPIEVHRALAFILVAKLLKKKIPALHERTYRQHTYSPEVRRAAELARQRRGRKIVSTTRGQAYDLDKIFRRLNYRYFEGGLSKPTLTWSRTRTHRILGHHDSIHDTIVISKTLDSHDVPEWLVEFVLYHEMLHIKHPARIVNGRRHHHTKAFRTDEKRFPFYEQAQELIEQLVREQRRTRKRAS